MRRLKAKGFVSSNVVFRMGSFTYQYNMRDTFGFAMKATWGEVNGKGRTIFKEPKTDNRLKRSACGLLRVSRDELAFCKRVTLPVLFSLRFKLILITNPYFNYYSQANDYPPTLN